MQYQTQLLKMKIVGKFFASKQQISLVIVKFFLVNSIFMEDDAAASSVMHDDDDVLSVDSWLSHFLKNKLRLVTVIHFLVFRNMK